MNPGVGAVNCGAELTRLGATDHGAEVPRTHNHLANLASDVALGSASQILAAELGPLICGAELDAIYTPFFPSSRASIICFPLLGFYQNLHSPKREI